MTRLVSNITFRHYEYLILNHVATAPLEGAATHSTKFCMKEKQVLISSLEEIAKSSTSNLSVQDKEKLLDVILELQKANSKRDVLKALKPLADLLGLLKALAELFDD
jgi:hypothetical protein